MFTLRSFAQPFHGFIMVLGYALPITIEPTELFLGVLVALDGSFQIPFRSFGIIWFDPILVVAKDTTIRSGQTFLSWEVALLCSLLVPLHSFLGIRLFFCIAFV